MKQKIAVILGAVPFLLLAFAGVRHVLAPQPQGHDLLDPAPVCEAPCWEGIVPGQTPRAEALDRLAALPYVTLIQESDQSVAWSSRLVLASGQQSVMNFSGGRVRDIYDCGGYETLGELIGRYGNPSAVHVTPAEYGTAGNAAPALNLLFTTHGIDVDASRHGRRWLGAEDMDPDDWNITPDWVVGPCVHYRSARDVQAEIAHPRTFNGPHAGEPIVPWAGYQAYTAYMDAARATGQFVPTAAPAQEADPAQPGKHNRPADPEMP